MKLLFNISVTIPIKILSLVMTKLNFILILQKIMTQVKMDNLISRYSVLVFWGYQLDHYKNYEYIWLDFNTFWVDLVRNPDNSPLKLL